MNEISLKLVNVRETGLQILNIRLKFKKQNVTL